MELLKRLSETPGISGQEQTIRNLIAGEMGKLVDETTTDVLGNLIGQKKGSGKRAVMISAHMDEIGFMVSFIDDKGFIRIMPVGGFDARALFAQRVVVHGKQDLPGVLALATKPIHLLDPEEAKKAPKVSDYFVDVGMGKEQVDQLVAIGDSVTMYREFSDLGELVTGKALDDRVGVYVMLKALERVKTHEVDIYAVASTQEEVGLRGAKTSSFGIDPEIGVALDVTLASDIPGGAEHEKITSLGKGVAIKIMDNYSISNPKVVQRLKELAEQKHIPYQLEVLPRGGTDAGAIQATKSGVAAVTISVPTRYVHTVVETCDKSDIEAAINLLAAFLEVAHEGDFRP
ncbi:MAG: M42 family metallopeptidase [Chloroflexi bacterium]|nr:M42 family metallopeptidase [Chloroflexota bacterium]